MSDVPDEVRRLAAEREELRQAKDFTAADALRDRIAEMGFTVIDSPEGPCLEPVGGAPDDVREAGERVRPEDVPSALEQPATFEATVHWLLEGWPEDVARGLGGFRSHQGGRSVQYVVADVTGHDPTTFDDRVELIPLVEGAGWAAARNAGLKRSLGQIVLVVDGSIEPVGDVFGPIEEALADPAVGVVGPFGIVTTNLQDFEASNGPEVDAIEGYLMAMRREVLLEVGLFDEKFKWYRTADIEYSFRLREAGLKAMVTTVPVIRHEHRMWFNTPPKERAKWSKRNYYRFLDRFRGRFDLLVGGEPPRS
ncbi:MAG TPA: glycosyltransferase [Actinomycetota bacterium]|nr:glycosyltransferase [Actinomycetota bacterium]